MNRPAIHPHSPPGTMGQARIVYWPWGSMGADRSHPHLCVMLSCKGRLALSTGMRRTTRDGALARAFQYATGAADYHRVLRRRRVCKNRERVLYLVSVSESVLKEVLRNRVVAVEGADERLDVVEHRDRSQIHCKNSTSTAIESDLHSKRTSPCWTGRQNYMIAQL